MRAAIFFVDKLVANFLLSCSAAPGLGYVPVRGVFVGWEEVFGIDEA